MCASRPHTILCGTISEQSGPTAHNTRTKCQGQGPLKHTLDRKVAPTTPSLHQGSALIPATQDREEDKEAKLKARLISHPEGGQGRIGDGTMPHGRNAKT